MSHGEKEAVWATGAAPLPGASIAAARPTTAMSAAICFKANPLLVGTPRSYRGGHVRKLKGLLPQIDWRDLEGTGPHPPDRRRAARRLWRRRLQQHHHPQPELLRHQRQAAGPRRLLRDVDRR